VDNRNNENGTENAFATSLTGKCIAQEGSCESAQKGRLYATYNTFDEMMIDEALTFNVQDK
jgi:hypothetical protein